MQGEEGGPKDTFATATGERVGMEKADGGGGTVGCASGVKEAVDYVRKEEEESGEERVEGFEKRVNGGEHDWRR